MKINGLTIAGAILAFAFSYCLYSVFGGGGAALAITALISAIMFLAIIFLQAIFIKDTGRMGIMLFLETVAMFLPFIFYVSSFILVGVAITYLMMLWGGVSGKSEMQQAMKIKIFRLGKFILPKAITAISIFVAASYISFFQDQNLVISRETFMKIVPTVDAVAKFVYPNLSLEDSFESALTEISGGENLNKEQIEASRDRFGRLIKLDFDAKESLVNIIYDAYKNYAMAIPSGQKILILVALGFALFITVRSVGAPIYWLVALITAFIYEILLALGFAAVVLETRSKEIVLLK
ncbi:MAG: hypothetical protein HYT12_04355 [Candidatus Liptonbacteria bacterium]|nr:hypothetical protein [Candidatus Liptonbacteria bacterium]